MFAGTRDNTEQSAVNAMKVRMYIESGVECLLNGECLRGVEWGG